MAKKDSVSVNEEYQCVKEVDCDVCGTTFRFPYRSTVSGSGETERDAQRDAAKKAQKELTDETGSERCPNCGALQVCMEAGAKALGFGCATWLAGFLFLVGGALAAVNHFQLISYPTMPMICWLLGLFSLPVIAWTIFLARSNANLDLEQGLREAKQKLESQHLTIVSAGEPGAVQLARLSMTSIQMVALGMGILGLLLLPSAELLRIASGWTMNSNTTPPVVGPGDDLQLNWPESLQCVKGHWRGTATVEYTDAERTLPSTPLAATTRSEDWGNFIGGRGARNQTTLIWATVKIPDDPGLAGKTIRLNAQITVNYPTSTGLFGFENREDTLSHEFPITLAPAMAGSTYKIVWWGGLVIGAGLILLSAYTLRRGQLNLFKACARPRTFDIRPAD